MAPPGCRRTVALTGPHPQKLRDYLKMMETPSTNQGLTDILKGVEVNMLLVRP